MSHILEVTREINIKMISVIIPTHNREDVIGRAIESVLQQTYKDVEIVVVSDGSTDNTEEVVKKIQSKHDNIQLISVHPNKGANNARNEGIRAAQGEYIAFLDDDDDWELDKLEAQMKVFEKDNSVGLVYTGINIIYVNEDINYNSLSEYKGDLSKEILIRNIIGATSSVMVKKEVLDKSGYFDVEMPAKQDYDLWIRACQHTNVDFVKEPKLNYYNYTGGNQISGSVDRHEQAVALMNQKYNSLFANLSESEQKLRQSNINTSITNVALRNNNKKLAIKYSYEAFKSKPSVKSLLYTFSSVLPFKWLLKIKKSI